MYRIGKFVTFKSDLIKQFYHINCIFHSFGKARLESNIIRDIKQIDGIDDVPDQVKQNVEKLVESTAEIPQKQITPKTTIMKSVLKDGMSIQKSCALKQSGLQSLTVLYTNADQLTSSKIPELKKHIDSVKPHIVAICEVKRKNGICLTKMDFEIQGYTLHPLNLDNDVGRGIAIYVADDLEKSVNQIESLSKFEEACLLEIRLRGGDIMLIGCIYRSPTISETSYDNNTRLNRLLSTITKKKYSHVCLVGDFNYKDINWENLSTPKNELSDEYKFVEAIKDAFLHQHTDMPTRRRGNDNPSLLDLILTDEKMQVSDIEHLAPLGKSDHSVLVFDFHCYIDFSKPQDHFAYDKGNYFAMRNYMEKSKWAEQFGINEYNTTTVEDKWNDLKGLLHKLRNDFVPLIKVKGKTNWPNKDSFPIDTPTRSTIKEKNRAFRNWMSSLGANKEERRLEYVRVRNKCKTALRTAKRNYEKGIADRSKINPKRFWKHVRRKLKSKPGVAPLLENSLDKDSIRYSDQDKANILQSQFSSVFVKEPDGNLPEFHKRTSVEIRSLLITEEMVKEELKSLNPHKSIGPDDIHPRLLKELSEYIAGPLAYFFNLTIKEGCTPHDWKKAFVSPIYKKGSKSIAENYRPISLTSILCKMMEKFVRSCIVTHLFQNNLLSDRQFGFLTGRSTVLQLLYYLDNCVNIIADGGVVDTIYMDFSKAFDTVAHKRLLHKISAYGICGELLNWIKAFLTGRSQIVKVNGTESNPVDVISGVPQGSVLGPLLFVIYINDILDDINSDGLLYADDTKIFRMISCENDALVLQDDIENLERWSEKWLLKFHPSKCHVLSLGRFENIQHTQRYKILNKELEHVFEEKDLGVLIDSDLTFAEHISSKVNLANSVMGLIRRSFSYLDKHTFKKLYSAFVRPHLEYAQCIWSPKSKKYVDMIENVQRRATKLVDGLANCDYMDRLRYLDLPTLVYRRSRGDMIEMFKHFNVYQRETLSKSFHPKSRPSRQHDYQLHERRTKDGERGVHSK